MSMPMLTVRDRGLRWRSAKFATAVAYYLQGAGLPVSVRDDGRPFRLSEVILEEAPDLDTGTLVGLKSWSIRTHADQKHDWSANLREVQQGKGRKRFAAVIQYRRAPAAAGEMYVLMSLEDFAQVVAITEGVEQ